VETSAKLRGKLPGLRRSWSCCCVAV